MTVPVQFGRAGGTGWTSSRALRHNSVMAKLDLTPDELGAVAQACRIAAHQADQDAGKQSSPTTRAGFEASAGRYRDLAKTFEAVRRAAACVESGNSVRR